MLTVLGNALVLVLALVLTSLDQAGPAKKAISESHSNIHSFTAVLN